MTTKTGTRSARNPRIAAILAAAIVVSGTSITNITGNGHTVTYDASATENAYLAGGTYTLAGGGTLTPAA